MNILTIKKALKANSSSQGVILVSNSYCLIRGFPSEGLEVIRKTLTYDNQEVLHDIQALRYSVSKAFRFKNVKKANYLKARIAELETKVKVCWLKKNAFPTGHLSLVKEALDSSKIPYTVTDHRENRSRRVTLPWAEKPLEPRYFQKEMLEIGLKKHRGVFVSAVGSGKTYTMQLLTNSISVPTLIILPSKDLSVQTYDSFSKAFGSNNVELVATKGEISKKPIRICTIQTLAAANKKGQVEPFLAGIGMICVDELHHSGAASYSNLLPYLDHIYYRFGFTGTFMRNDSRSLDMWGFLSTVLYTYSAAKATEEGFLTPLKVLVHEIGGIKGSTYQTEYGKNYCQNQRLLEAIKDILDTTQPEDQILILVGQKEKSGHIIKEFLDELGLASEYVSGDSKREHVRRALQDFNNKKVPILIGSSIIGEGIDVRSTSHLIMAQGGKSEISVTQAVGRAVRLYPGKKVAYLHDFRFLGTKYLESHLEKRLQIYEKNFDGEIL